MVPKGWSSVQAQDVCKSISVGVVIKPTQYYVPEGYGVKAFRSANVREGFINDSDWVYFSHEGHAINKKSHLKTGDVLIVRTGYPGTACVVTPEFEGSNAIDIVIARPDMDKIIPEYLCAYTNSHIGKSQVLDLQGGMAQKHLNVGAYQVLKINLPPLREQKKIAQILSTWDKAITVTEKLLANSQRQKKALMQQLLTGKKRLLDENGERFSGEWKQDVNLGSIINISKGVQINKNTLSEDGQFPVINGGIAPSGFTSEFNTDENTITISEGGNSCGYVAFQKKSFWCGGHCYAVRKTALDLSFTFHLLKYNELKIMGLRVGSGLPNIQKKAIEAFTVNFPVTSVEQQKIAAVLSAADDEIATLEKKLACLKDEKKALMQQLLTGKRRVKIDEAVAA
ncbi:restriction endonuclease subunit S [Klebsiella pneumoniae]|uniref:restriction endonuclease subunit S n=2 Tax=Klebsiella pneumoniae TaxID=573 RepID=UPI0010EAEDA3|nr:restriction endonuclease subunit S [Klebsiella pneumoniae]HBR1674901.1 restriction endonuclease subunit S [Klebsiella quasipneumoniae subsp. quasipneumoniae]MCP6478873.1 restriction endonuclease subunit S [Klebsiella pneumoniae]VGH58280.1 Restriction modification system DNA specificity domain protein [Klebsiella pneumoniae]HBR8945880.1 restriction endonuclease subunit S [Klebsiella pneumoniae]HCB0061837.1 restriction endonuclease subunit S [Klebsiella pneumoniae]